MGLKETLAAARLARRTRHLGPTTTIAELPEGTVLRASEGSFFLPADGRDAVLLSTADELRAIRAFARGEIAHRELVASAYHEFLQRFNTARRDGKMPNVERFKALKTPELHYASELPETNPCPDYALRAIYRQDLLQMEA